MAAEATLRMILLGEDRSAGKTLKNVGDQADRSTGRMQRMGNVAGKVLAGGFLVAGAAAVKMTRAAAQDQAAQVKLANTLHNAAGATKAQVAATEDWITAQGKALGVTDDELRPALGTLTAATHDVSKAQKLASLAMDVSAGRGKSLSTVSEALAKAQNGNIGALGRLGVATKDADGKTKSLHQITKDLTDLYGGAAQKNAETTEGKQKRLTVALGEAGETIGYKLLPFMLKMVDAGMKVLDWMQKNQKIVVILGGALLGLVTAVWAINAAAKAYRATQAALNIVMSANPIALVVLAVAALVAGFIIAYKKSETFRSIVDGAMRGVAKAVDFARDHWKLLIALLLGPLGIAIGLVIDHFNAIKTVVGNVVRFVVNTFLGMVGAIIHAAASAFGWVPGLGGKLKSAAKNFDNFRDRVNAALDGIHSVKEIHLNVTTRQSVTVSSINKPRTTYDHSAVGRQFWGGGVTTVGERGPEDVLLPRGSRILTAAETARMGSGGGTVRHEHVLVVKYPDGRTIRTILLDDSTNSGAPALV